MLCYTCVLHNIELMQETIGIHYSILIKISSIAKLVSSH
jgi:hypothetical protein